MHEDPQLPTFNHSRLAKHHSFSIKYDCHHNTGFVEEQLVDITQAEKRKFSLKASKWKVANATPQHMTCS